MRIRPQLIVVAVAVVFGMIAFSCSSSGKSTGPEVSVDDLKQEIVVLETKLRQEIAEAKSMGPIYFVLGVGIGLLAFLFVQHQIKRLRLEMKNGTHIVPPDAGTNGGSKRSVAVKTDSSPAKKRPAAKKKVEPSKDSPG